MHDQEKTREQLIEELNELRLHGSSSGFSPAHADHDGPFEKVHKRGYLEEIEDLYNNAPCGYHSLAPDGSFIRINDTELNWLGYYREEMIDRMNFADILTEESLQTFRRNFPGFKQRGWVKDLEFDLVRKDGSTLPVLLSATAVTDENGIYVMSRATVFDITTRKQLETELQQQKDNLALVLEKRTEELRQSEERFRMLFEQHDAIMLIVDPDTGAIVDANLAASDFYGCSREELRNKGLQDIKLLAPKAILEETRKAKTRKESCFVVPHLLLSGKTRIVEVHSSPVVMHNKTLLFSIIHDITERKKTEEDLAFTQFVVDHMRDTVLWTTAQGKIVYVNKAGVNKLGYSIETFRSLGVWDLIPDFHQDDWSSFWKELNEKGTCTIETLHKTKFGHTFPVEVLVNYFSFDAEEYACAVARDISLRKTAEQAVIENEENFRLVVSAIPDSICLTDLANNKFIQINKAFTSATGYTPEDVENGFVKDFNLWDDQEEYKQARRSLMETGMCSNLQAVFRRKDGSLFTGLFSASLISVKGNLCILSITRDISVRVQIEREKEQLQKQLFEAQKMASLGTLVGGIAHDFNNMLQAIIGYSEIMMLDKTPESDGYKDLTTILRTSRGGAELVKKLLAFAQQAHGYPVKLDLNEILCNLESLITHTISSKIQVEMNLAENLASIKADPSHVEQSVMNVVINASEAMPNGGKLMITTSSVYLNEEYCRSVVGVKPGNYVKMSVSDSGRGMDSATLAQIFDPFFSTKQRGSLRGTGMGLSVVKGIVQQQGGHITCESEPGAGTTITIYFPAIEVSPRILEPTVPNLKTRAAQTILLVEDSIFQARVERKFLESAGFEVIWASTWEEAVDIFEKEKDKISMVILDLILPEMSGKDCLMELVRIKPSIRVLLVSGFGLDHEQSRELDPYIHGFLLKPFKASQLLEKTVAILEEVPE